MKGSTETTNTKTTAVFETVNNDTSSVMRSILNEFT